MTATQTPEQQEIVELKAQLRAAAKEQAKLEAQVADLQPTVDITDRLFRNVEDVYSYFGLEKLEQAVRDEDAASQRQRNKKGYQPSHLTDDEVADRVRILAEAFVEDRLVSVVPEAQTDTYPPLDRTLKMVAPNGALVQIAYEAQINNVAGSLADGYIRYEMKGYKQTRPFLCPTKDCWEPAAITGGRGRNAGKLEFKGYCTQDHLTRTESGKGAQSVPSS